MRGLQRCLLAAGCPHVDVFTYDASGRVRFDVLGGQLAERIRSGDGPVNLVGFSMGGLVIRAALCEDPQIPLRRAVFLNTPHQGSKMAFLPLEGVRQMRPGSAFLRRLHAQPWGVPTLAMWCPGDMMVVPGSSARWERATRTLQSGVPIHVWPLFSRSVHAEVAKFLTAPE